MPAPNQRTYDAIHDKNVELYGKRIKRAYNRTIDEVVKLTYKLSLDRNSEFYWRNNKDVSKKVDKLLKQLNTEVYGITVNGIDQEWGLAVDKNNEIAIYAAGDKLQELPSKYKNKWFTSNEGAKNAFLKRKINGLGLSDKVWKNTRQMKVELELALEVGIGKGKSAANLSKDIRGYLNKPDSLYRKVRSNQNAINSKLADLKLLKDNDAALSQIRSVKTEIDKLRLKGTLRLSKAAKAYKPGRGVYRSSFKNALRLTVNETNFSYETGGREKREQQDFIVGIEIKVSPSHVASDDSGGISCLQLQGKYPKNYNWDSKNHTNCKCSSFNILKTRDELDKDIDNILAGKEPNTPSKNQVSKNPASFNKYVKENNELWKNWKNKPRFLVNQ